jgi:PAS domain S-box-containing protein
VSTGSRHRLATNLGFAVAILLLAWVGWRAYRDGLESRTSAGAVTHTYQVLETLHAIVSSLHDAERGQRGHVISGKEEYLQPYRRSVTEVESHLTELQNLTADNPAQQERLKALAGITARRVASLERTLSTRRAHGLDSALARILSGPGQALMDSARSTIAEMQSAEQALLRTRSDHAEAHARGTQLGIILATGLGLLLLITSAALANREIRARLKAEAGVRRANEGLEDRVAERTEELECMNEELRVQMEERDAIEVQVRRERKFLRKVVDANPQLIFLKDWDGRFVLANHAVAEVYGTTVEQLEGKTDADFNPDAAEVEAFLRHDREVINSGRTLVIPEEPVTGRTGATRWFQTIKVPLIAADGTRQVLGVSTDITARRHTEEQLRRTADELEALVQAAPVAIVGIDMEGKVLSWHGGAQAMFGWTADELVGRTLAIVPSEKQEEFRALRNRAEHGASIVGLETYRVRKDGSRIDVSISYAPLHDRQGNTVGATIVYQDITERQLIAEQRQARETAEAANYAKSNFLANMSHELRTPLNAIIGFSELLEDRTFGPLNEKQQRYVTNVRTSGRHLLQLVNDILDLAKVEAGRLVLDLESINVTALLHDMQRGLEPLAVAKRQTFTLEIPEELPALIADRSKVKQILYNLLSNAIKFTKEGGRLGLRASSVPGDDEGQPQIQIAVWDSGIGIAPEDVSRIFLEFEQLDSSYVRQQEGTGLGLALTQRLVEAHGGRIWVESTLGGGSTFTLLLPASRRGSDVGSAVVTPERILRQDRQRPLVLVVEDDTTGRELLSHYLVENGYAVAYAGTGAEAFEMARLLRPAAISLDILLPDVHGLDLLRRLRADPQTKEIPLIVVSITDDRELGLSAGAAAWLVKPVDRRQFIEALSRVMPNGNGAGNKLALVVDDDADAVELATDVLRQRGFEVLQAFGGSDGLTLALARLPGLIVLDLSMPGMSGFTVAQQLRADPRTRHTPILVSTALDLSSAEREALLRHVQTIVPKSGPGGILEALERLGLSPELGAA